MITEIIKIAVLCIVIGGASIPVSFTISSSPWIVWIGNALGSLLSALVVFYIGDRLTSQASIDKYSKRRFTKKVVTVFEEGDDNKKVQKASIMIDKHGLRLFALLCPIFPGVLISTVVVYALNLDKHIFKKWLMVGITLVSGFYVFSYWFMFVR